MYLRRVRTSGLMFVLSATLMVSVPTRAQSPADACGNEPEETRNQCIKAYTDKSEQEKKWKDLKPHDGPSLSPQVDQGRELRERVRQACGLVLPPASRSGTKDLIIVAAAKRQSIDDVLRSPQAPAADVEGIDVDACFSELGPDYVVVSPSDKPDKFTVIGNEGALSSWLRSAAASAGVNRVRLAPKSDCAELLNKIGNRGRAVWVEDERGLSLCELDASGTPQIDPNKVNGYSGVIVLKVGRS